MKILIIVFTFTFLAVLNVATAAGLTDRRRLNNCDQKQIKQSISEVRTALEDFNLSKGDIKIREQEALIYMELSLKAINADETGDSESFLFRTYESDETAFNRALQKMDEKKAIFIRHTIEQTRRAFIEGQDTVK